MSRRAAFGARLTGDDSPAPPTPAPAANSPARPRAQSNAGARGARGGGNKGKGRADQGRGQQASRSTAQQAAAAASSGTEDRRAQVLAVNARAAAMAKAADEAGETDQDGEICFICAEGPVQYWSVGECNHRTCHTCSIRLRALYKKNECTFCKTECPTVVFTGSDDKPFEDFKPEDTPFSDTKLGVLFETRAQLDDTLSLLRFNCPYKPGLSDPASAAPDDPAEACQHILAGWSDLKRHVRSSHHCTLCDLCCSNKKIFTHEHELFAMSNPNNNGGGGHQQQGRRKGTELDHHLEKEHSMCGFCKRWFYDSDGLYKHCREQHEECFICTKQGIRHQYHLNYDRLEQHFKSDHYLCPHPDCLAQKFVVFESELDLQAHALEVHGVGSSVDQKARKEARRIETSFTYSTGETSRGATNDGGAGAGRRRAAGGRAPVASFVEPAREDPVQTPRGERRVPGLGAIQALGSGSGAAGGSGSNSRAARFGGQLTPDPASTPLSRSGASTPTPTSGSESHDAATLERHAALMRRVQDAANGHEGKIAGFKFAVRSYRAGELGARDLCDQLYNIFDQRTDEAGKIVLAFADLLEEEDKKRSLRNAWREMSSENQFPSLIALAPTLNGVPTQVNNTSQRALSAQHRSGVNPSSTWARVEQAAHSSGPAPVAPRSNPFPALMAASNAREIPGLSKAGLQKKRNVGGGGTAWSSAASAGTRPSPSTSGTRHSAGSAFPTLGAVASSSSSSAPISRVGSVAPPSSVNRPTSAFAGSSRGAVSIPRAPNGLEFPSLPASNSEADRRARMRAALAKPAGRTVLDDGEADGGIWNGTGSVGGEGDGSSLGANGGGGGKKKGKGRQKVVLMSGGLASQPQ